jgi:O-antigen/teichoic acid export membrane protein
LFGFEAYKAVTINEIAYGVISLIITILLARAIGIVGAIVGMLCAHLAGAVLMGRSALLVCRKFAIPCSIRFDSTINSSFNSFVLPAFLSSIIVLPINWCINIVLARSAGYAELSVYTVSYQWVMTIAYIMSLFTRVKPIYTDLYAKGEFVEFKKLLGKMMQLSSLLGIPVAIVGIIGSKWIMSFYGTGYSKYWMVFSIMMFASIAMTLQSQFGAVLEAIGKMWIGFILNIIWAINLLVIFYLLRSYGAFGCSIAFLISYFLHCIYSWSTIIILKKKMAN